VAVTDLAAGLPIGSNMIYQGNFFDLLSLYSILGGLVFVLVFAYHGASFLQLRLTDKGLLYKIQGLGKCAGGSAVMAYVLYLLLTMENTDLLARPCALGLFLATAVFFLASLCRFAKKPDKSSFILGALAIASVTVGFFTGMFPRLMVSSLNPDWSLTITNASSTEYTLSIMTVAAFVLVPIVLVYQIWTYYIFRKRLCADDPAPH
jgi:cytochrome d ubiquinol oxidase subunit II